MLFRSVPAEAGTRPNSGSRSLPALLTTLGLLLFVLPVALAESGIAVSASDVIAARMLALVVLLAAWCGFSLGPGRLRALAFPLGLLVLAAPLPLAARAGVFRPVIRDAILLALPIAIAASLLDLLVYPEGTTTIATLGPFRVTAEGGARGARHRHARDRDRGFRLALRPHDAPGRARRGPGAARGPAADHLHRGLHPHDAPRDRRPGTRDRGDPAGARPGYRGERVAPASWARPARGPHDPGREIGRAHV